MKKRVFVSYDYDHDRSLYGDLVAQAGNPDSPFAINDRSLPGAVDGNWKRQARQRIRQADLVIFICGVNTHSAPGVEAEMSITHDEGKPYVLLQGRSSRTCSKPKNARSSDVVHRWTWTNLKELLR